MNSLNKIKIINITYCLIIILGINIEVYQLQSINLIPIILSSIAMILTLVALNLPNAKWIKITYLWLINLILLTIFLELKNSNPFVIMTLSNMWIIILSFLHLLIYKTLFNNNELFLNKLNYYLPLLSIIFFSLFFIILNHVDHTLNLYDHARHTLNAYTIYDIWNNDQSGKLFSILSYYDFYQPLVYITALPFIILFGKSYTSVCLSIPLIWLPIGYYFGFKLLKERLKCSREVTGVFLFVILGSGLATSLQRQFMLDFPTLSIFIVFLYFYFKSFLLTNKTESKNVGIVIGVGLLVKSSFIILIIPFLLFAFYRAIVKCINKKSINFLLILLENLPILMLNILLFGGWWYIINLSHFNYTFSVGTTENGQKEGDPYPYSIDSLLWYIKQIPVYFSYPVLIFFFYSIFKTTKFKTPNYLKYSLIFAVAFCFAIGTITWNKDVRTLFPLTIILVIFMALYVDKLESKNYIILLTSLILFVFIQNYSSVFGDPLHLTQFKIIPEPYVMNNRIGMPNEDIFTYENKPIYEKLCAEANLKTIPELEQSYISTYYSEKVFLNKMKISISDTSVSSDSVFFYKSMVWKDYYLIKFSIKNDTLISKILSKNVSADGDKTLILSTKDKTWESNFNSEYEESKIPLNNCSEVNVGIKLHYTRPSGQIIALIYQLLHRDFNVFNNELLCMSKGKHGKTWVLKR